MLLDLFFPKLCVNCGRYGAYVCPDCRKCLTRAPVQICPVCGNYRDMGSVCQSCSCSTELEAVLVAGEHSELLKFLVHSFKYRSIQGLDMDLSSLLQITWAFSVGHTTGFCLVPVPVHPRKVNMRGFNQSERMAYCISKYLSIPLNPCLRKNRMTLPQMELTRDERMRNITGSFSYAGGKYAFTRAILLDDVYTTGSTLNECARVLKQEGDFQSVWGLVLSRGL